MVGDSRFTAAERCRTALDHRRGRRLRPGSVRSPQSNRHGIVPPAPKPSRGNPDRTRPTTRRSGATRGIRAQPDRSDDKKAGLYVYGLGRPAALVPGRRLLNNVDLIDRGRAGVLVVASDRNDSQRQAAALPLDPEIRGLQPLGAVTGGAGEAYGVCLWQARDAI